MNNRSYICRDAVPDVPLSLPNAMLVTTVAGYAEYDTPFELERIRDDYYIMYISGGSLSVTLGTQTQKAEVGDLVLFHNGDLQHYSSDGNSTFKYYWIHFTGYAADHVLRACGFTRTGIYHVGLNDNVIQCFNNHFADFYGKPVENTYMEISAAAHLMEIFTVMRGILDGHDVKSGSAEQKVFASAKYINENYTLPLSVEELAAHQGLCSGYYSKMFVRFLGSSPQSYLIRIRLQNACMLLRQSDMSVAQISSAVGYGDPLYFSRVFRKNIGVSPAEYRRMYRSNDKK